MEMAMTCDACHHEHANMDGTCGADGCTCTMKAEKKTEEGEDMMEEGKV